MDVEPFLRYDVLGILLAVLVGVGVFARSWFKREQDRQDRREEREAERERMDRADRKELSDSLTALKESDIESKDALRAALDGLCNEVRADRQQASKMGRALDLLVAKLERHEERAQERHELQMAQGKEHLEALRRFNGG
jgi:hypothetical protein